MTSRADHARERLAALLFDADPIGIAFEDNTDEYEPEAASMLEHLSSCRSYAEVQSVVHAVFTRWFHPQVAGPPERYAGIALRIVRELPELCAVVSPTLRAQRAPMGRESRPWAS